MQITLYLRSGGAPYARAEEETSAQERIGCCILLENDESTKKRIDKKMGILNGSVTGNSESSKPDLINCASKRQIFLFSLFFFLFFVRGIWSDDQRTFAKNGIVSAGE